MSSKILQSGSPEQATTKLIILGAGCSLKRYPLAKDMVAHLKQFAESLDETAPRLHALVGQTVDVFDRLRVKGVAAQTLDELAHSVHSGQLADNNVGANQIHNDRLVEDAKLAVAASFFAKEGDALTDGLPGYRSLMKRIFSSSFGSECLAVLKNTPYRVLSFNYDRLFELAFRQYFPYDGTEAFYGPTVLNSGLFHVLPQQVQVELNRFSFLKLHGSVGLYSYEQAGGPHHNHQIPDLIQRVPITDDEFFTPAGHGIHSNKPKPALIVFPHEKDYLSGCPDNRFPFRRYIPEVWEAAKRFARQASEIWFVGYSCPEPDFPAWSSLIAAAGNCELIVVWNPAADNICERLRLRLPKKASLFHGANHSFDQF